MCVSNVLKPSFSMNKNTENKHVHIILTNIAQMLWEKPTRPTIKHKGLPHDVHRNWLFPYTIGSYSLLLLLLVLLSLWLIFYCYYYYYYHDYYCYYCYYYYCYYYYFYYYCIYIYTLLIIPMCIDIIYIYLYFTYVLPIENRWCPHGFRSLPPPESLVDPAAFPPPFSVKRRLQGDEPTLQKTLENWWENPWKMRKNYCIIGRIILLLLRYTSKTRLKTKGLSSWPWSAHGNLLESQVDRKLLRHLGINI